MADWTLIDVPDSATQYVGKVLEDAGKTAQSNFEDQAARTNEVADAAKAVFLIQIAQAAG